MIRTVTITEVSCDHVGDDERACTARLPLPTVATTLAARAYAQERGWGVSAMSLAEASDGGPTLCPSHRGHGFPVNGHLGPLE